jgi:hypothetical protein
LSEILPQNNKIDGYPVEHVFPGIGRKRVLLNARRMIDTVGVRGPMILLAVEDVTQKESQREKQPV